MDWKDGFPDKGVYLSPKDGILYNGDAYGIVDMLPDNSIDCVITSPPYWALRDYNVEGQVGLEPTVQEYVNRLVELFDKIWRVLKPAGTLWVNLGDTYMNSDKRRKKVNGYNDKEAQAKIRNKSLVLAPERFAISMVDKGWILRNVIIWHKPDALPDSTKDRFTRDFEYIYFFTKSEKYYFKQVLEPYKSQPRAKTRCKYAKGGFMSERKLYDFYTQGGRNKRTVWTIAKSQYQELHYAVFPEELPKTCMEAGCPPNGIVLDPFAGTGTTLAVARKTGRRWIGIEINEYYCQLAKKRLEQVPLNLFVNDVNANEKR